MSKNANNKNVNHRTAKIRSANHKTANNKNANNIANGKTTNNKIEGKKRDKLLARKRLIVVVSVIASLFTVVASVGVGVLLGVLKELPPPESLEYYSPPQVTRVYDSTGDVVICEFFKEKRVVLPIKAIPEQLVRAIIAVEDERFYNHIGVDPRGVLRALVVNVMQGKIRQGGSTITQQLARNVFEEITHKRSFKRKFKEALFSLYVEKRYSKEQIMEFYLNQIYFGNGAYGVGAAARTFFDKEVDDLTLAECATIAGIPQRPLRFSPINNIAASRDRRNTVLFLMRDLGYISGDLYERAVGEEIVLKKPKPIVNKAPYFVDHVRRVLSDDKRFAGDALLKGGYRVYTTIDLNIQKAAEESLREGLHEVENLWQQRKTLRARQEEKDYAGLKLNRDDVRLAVIKRREGSRLIVAIDEYSGEVSLPEHLPYLDSEAIVREGNRIDVRILSVGEDGKTFRAVLFDEGHIQGAIVVLDAHTGEVLALVGGYDYYDNLNKGQWNRAVQGGRQAGSGIKPLFFAGAIEMGFTPAEIFIDREVVFSDGYSPVNYEGVHYGPTTIHEALVHSRNVVSVLLMQDMGAGNALRFVSKFDFTTTRKHWKIPHQLNSILGLVELTPLELAASFSAFANNGVGERPNTVRFITDQKKKLVKRFKPYETIVMSPQTGHIMTTMMMGVVRRGTGLRSVGKFFSSDDYPQIAGKTGTTNDCVDAWFTGYTPDLVVSVYVGFDRQRSLGPKMTGSRVAAPIFTRLLKSIFPLRNDWQMEFDKPDNIIFAYVCSKSGELWTDSCGNYGGRKYRMAFKTGTHPVSGCSVHGEKGSSMPQDSQLY